jgi:hypothetical protein
MELMTTENPRWNEFADALDQMGAKFGCDGDHPGTFTDTRER